MRNGPFDPHLKWMWVAAALLAGACLTMPTSSAQPAADSGAAALDRPDWKIGDTWTIETATQRVQGREIKPSENPPRVRWQFKVAKIEKIAGQDCYRVDVQCLAQGRVRPQTTLWCEKESLFLRQFQTQLAFDGRYHVVQESYECEKGTVSPVLASINALPLSMPAFTPKGSKAVGDFQFVSQPLPAGSKDSSMLRFSQSVSQSVKAADPQLVNKVLKRYSKDLDAKPITQVTLSVRGGSVVQLWQKGTPWPVYVNNGRTQAWLVTSTGL
jgi:hypothetical protein